MKTPLAESIVSRLFHEQPSDTAWHSFEQQQQQEGEGDAGGGGEGGGAAVADPPGGGGDDPNADILSFEMPNAGAIADDIIKGKTPDPATPPKTPAKPADTKTPATPAKPATPAAPEPIAQLRTSYEQSKAKVAELEQKLAAGDPRLAAAERERDALKAEVDAAKARNAEYEQQLALSDPSVVKELKDLDESYAKTAQRFYNSVPEIDHHSVSALVKEYAGLPFGKAEYRAARDAFEAKVNQALGGDENTTSRKLEKTLAWIEDSHDFAVKRPEVEQRVRTNAKTLKVESERTKFTERKTHVSGLIQKALTVPEGMDKTDPLHPRVVLKKFDEQLDPAVLTSLDKGVAEFVELAVNGVPPRTDQDYVGLSPEQISQRQAAEQKQVSAAKDHLVDIAVNGARALRRIPILMEMLSKYKERAGKVMADPDPGTGDPGASGGDGLDKIELPQIPSGLG